MKETQTNDESILNSKKPTSTNGQVKAEVRRFKEDFFLQAVNKTLVDIYSTAILKALIIKDDGTLKHIYDDKTTKGIKEIEIVRNDYIKANYGGLLKNA